MDYIVTKNKNYFKKIGDYNFCNLSDIKLDQIVTFDIETTGLKHVTSDITVIQVGSKTNNYVIKCYNDDYTASEVFSLLRGKTLLGQGLHFDLMFCYKHNFYPGPVLDTFLASKLLHVGEMNIKHGLGEIIQRELGVTLNKSTQKNIHLLKLSTATAIKYCFDDIKYLNDAHTILYDKLQANNSLPIYEDYCRNIRGLAYLQFCGCPLNAKKWEDKIKEDVIEEQNCKSDLIDYIYDTLPKYRSMQLDMFDTVKRLNISVTSPKQMLGPFKDLEIDIRDEEGKESLGKDIIEKSGHPLALKYRAFSEARHTITTFGTNIFEKTINNRIYTSYNPMNVTGRISTHKGDVNLLNLPANKRTRECIVAEEGFDIIVSDYDGQENICGADLHQDEVMVQSVLDGLDLHSALARKIFPEIADLSDNEVKKLHEDKRNFAKPIRFAENYGGSGFTLASRMNVSVEEGNKFDRLYKELHTGLFLWGKEVLNKAIKVGYIDTTKGYRIKLPQYSKFNELYIKMLKFDNPKWELYKEGKIEYKLKLKGEEVKEDYKIKNLMAYKFYMDNKSLVSNFYKLRSSYQRLCLNYPVQSLAAKQWWNSLGALFDFIVENNHQGIARVVVAPYDEFCLEVRKDLTPLYKKKLGEFMVNEGNKLLTSGIVFMSASADVGTNWYSAKKGENA